MCLCKQLTDKKTSFMVEYVQADSPVVSSSMTDDKPTLTPLMQFPRIMPSVGMKY